MIEKLLAEIKQIEEQTLKPKKDLLNKLLTERADSIGDKIEKCLDAQYSFKPEDLIFSAYTRCSCGAGYAYPKDIGVSGCWYCSDILLGRALSKDHPDAKEHSPELPFTFYEVKSENQPSAQGATTRPET